MRIEQPQIAVESQQRAIVVKHFFEVRNGPSLIDTIAAEAAADLVENAALGHFRQRQSDHRLRVFVALGNTALETEFKFRRMRKLRRITKPAFNLVETVF